MSCGKLEISLTDQEQERASKLVVAGDRRAYRVLYARILLLANEAGADFRVGEVADLVECHPNTVRRACRRFIELGLDATMERKQRTVPPIARKLGVQEMEALVDAVQNPSLAGESGWTLKTLADYLVREGVVDSISYETVRRALKRIGMGKNYLDSSCPIDSAVSPLPVVSPVVVPYI